MRKNKLSTAGLAAILSVALMSGGIFAWFASKDTAAQVDVSTGEVIIELEDFVPASTDILPGTSVDLGIKDVNGKVFPAKIKNSGSKAAVIELDLSGDALKAVLPATFVPADAKDWKDEFDVDYELKDVEIGGVTEQRYVFSVDRLAEVAKLEMETSTVDGEGWVKVDNENKFYTVLPAKEDLELTGFKLTVDQELGGNVGPKGTTQTDSRQFEQETQFLIEVKAMGTQATTAAVTDIYSAEALAALQVNGFVID